MIYSTHKDYRNDDNKMIPSVTTILKLMNKSKLLQWSNWLGFNRLKYDDVLNDKANIGTFVHELVERDFKNIKYDLSKEKPVPDDIIARYHRFLEFRDDHNIVPILIEHSISSDRYGGTIDFYGKVDGIYTIIDWKTSKSFYSSMELQLSAYKNLLENDNHKVEQAMIVLLHEDNYRKKVYSKDRLEKCLMTFEKIVDLFYSLEELNILKDYIDIRKED